MADKVDKAKKKAKPKKDEKGVLAALPSTRPERIGSRRGATAAQAPSPAASQPVAATSSSAAATATKPARAKPKRAAAKRSSRPTAARRKAAAPRTFEPTEAAEAAAGAADERAAGAVPRAETPPKPARKRTYPRPQPVREGAPGIGTGGYRDEPSPESARPSGVELATTAVRAAGEVAQLGLTVGGEVLKRVVRRLPRP
jgi:hypothetical protein